MSNHIYYPPYYEKNYWWNFRNVLSWFFGGVVTYESEIENLSDEELYDYMDEYGFEGLYPDLVNTTTEKAKQPIVDIFNLIQKRFAEHYCFYTEEDDVESGGDGSKEFLIKLFNVIEYTYKKYSKIIDLYNENYNDLMKQLETTTESGSRFNDTPQEAEVSLSYEDNVFTTNLTKSKSVTSADSNTPIVKIEEIFRNYRNVLLDWLNEFDSLFVEVHNI